MKNIFLYYGKIVKPYTHHMAFETKVYGELLLMWRIKIMIPYW